MLFSAPLCTIGRGGIIPACILVSKEYKYLCEINRIVVTAVCFLKNDLAGYQQITG